MRRNFRKYRKRIYHIGNLFRKRLANHLNLIVKRGWLIWRKFNKIKKIKMPQLIWKGRNNKKRIERKRNLFNLHCFKIRKSLKISGKKNIALWPKCKNIKVLFLPYMRKPSSERKELNKGIKCLVCKPKIEFFKNNLKLKVDWKMLWRKNKNSSKSIIKN